MNKEQKIVNKIKTIWILIRQIRNKKILRKKEKFTI